MYSYTWIAALTKGKPQESGNPHQTSQSAGQLFLVTPGPFPSSRRQKQHVAWEVASAGRAWFEAMPHAKAYWEKSLSLGDALYFFVERSERF